MLSLSLFSTKLSLCCNLFCFGVRSRCIFASLRNFWTTSISFTFFLSILFDNTSASYTEFFLFDIFQLSFNHHTWCSTFEDSPWQAWLLCMRQKDIWIGVMASAPPPLSHVLSMDPMASIDVDFRVSLRPWRWVRSQVHVRPTTMWNAHTSDLFSQGISQFLKPPHVSFCPLYTWHPQKHELAIVFSFFLLSWIDFCTHSKPCKDGYSDHRTAQWLQGYACHN